MRDLIFVSLEPWNAIWRRNQFLCAQLAARFPEMRLLFVESPLFTLDSWKSRKRVPTFSRRLRRIEGFPNVRAFTPVKPVPNPLPGGRAFNEKTMLSQIVRASKLAGLRDPLLWLNPFDFGFVRGHLNERGMVYDITDDWELAEPEGAGRERIKTLDREMCRQADLTIVCSRALFDSREGIAQRLLLLPNGVEAAHYANLEARDRRAQGHFDAKGVFCSNDGIPAEQPPPTGGKNHALWPRPVFGYTGSLHPERIDLGLVKALARAFPRGSVLLVGPDHFVGDSLRRELEGYPNVFAPGEVAYKSIPDIMAGFDVCIVPHQRSDFVESLNPIKLWEFLAAGKPIVSADVAGFRDFPHLVRLASDEAGFVEACREALQEVNACLGVVSSPPCLCESRQREAVGNSWRSRSDELLRALEEANLMVPTGANIPSPIEVEAAP
ncbi:putative teichuronic acid biosynthesis glycosyltransferase TuaH [Abditibacteriota bacterium]|nr:putative teichuronic acid biosynthesis glycosyltransferase TuaH [Abditibacteriota bacterium]